MENNEEIEAPFENYLGSLNESSAQMYRKRVSFYKQYCESEELDASNCESVDKFIQFCHDQDLFAVTTLWTIFSIVNTYFTFVHNIKLLENLPGLVKKMKQWEKEYAVTKSATLEKEEIYQYMQDENNPLLYRTAIAIAIPGFLRRTEIKSIAFENVSFHQDHILIRFERSKSKGYKQPMSYVITDPIFRSTISQYVALFPENRRRGQFLKNFKNGKPTESPTGVNTIGSIPKLVAKYLGKPNFKDYKGHCFRRTAATMLADSGATLLLLKKAGGWRSDSVAQSYVDNSMATKRKVADSLVLDENLKNKIQKLTETGEPNSNEATSSSGERQTQGHTISGNQNCVFHFYINCNMKENQPPPQNDPDPKKTREKKKIKPTEFFLAN